MNKKKQSFKLPLLLIAFVLLLGAAGAGLYLLYKDTTGPVLALSPDTGPVAAGKTFTVSAEDPVSGLKNLAVSVIQGDKRIIVLEKTFEKPDTKREETFTLPEGKLKDGPFSIEISATDASLSNWGKGAGSGMRAELVLDTKKPFITPTTYVHNLNQGGSGLAVFTLSEPAATAGIEVGDLFFPAYEQPDGSYVCLFAHPYYLDAKDFNPAIAATDRAGNQGRAGIHFHTNPKRYRNDTLNVPDSFLQRKMGQYRDAYPGKNDLQVYLNVNRDMRKTNREKLFAYGNRTSPAPLWRGAFLRPPGATTAGFGDKRTYMHNGREVDHQTHLGVDIAGVGHDEVPATNSGTVVFTGFFGIYGNAVIIDHGQGLQTLYSHLSSIAVSPGQQVAKGRTVGRTGSTGLAGGDHLHFGVILSGLPVNPLEWWDPKWVRNNISGKLGAE